jgi:flagellin
MRINTNVNALNTLRNLQQNEVESASSTSKLSSGFRINRAADDAAGLAIANKLRNTGAALGQAQKNAQQASAMLQIADGAAQSVAQIVDRMKELAQFGASDNIGSDGAKIQAEFSALNNEIDRIVNTTKYQGTSLLSGTGGGGVAISGGTYTDTGTDIASVQLHGAAASKTFTITSAAASNGVVSLSDGTTTQKVLSVDGAQTLNFDQLGVSITTAAGFKASVTATAATFSTKTILTGAGTGGSSLDFVVDATGSPSTNDKISVSLGTIAKLSGQDISSKSGAVTAEAAVDTLLGTVNTFLGDLGAAESRLDYAQKNLASTIQNTAAAESTIRDVDMAAEMANYSKHQILAQAGTSMLAQANSSSQSVLKLFQ